MRRNFHNSRGSSIHTGNSLPRWRTVLIALVLVLAIGSVGQTPTAQAAPAGVSAYFSMRVRNPKTTLRCGQTVTYHVVVDAAPSLLPTPSPSQLGIPRGISIVGVYVEADSTDKSVGDFVGAGRVRTTVSLDSELTTLIAAKFKFKANKPGKTTLYFDGLVGTEHVAVQLDVKVLPCRYKVKALGQWVDVYSAYSVSAVSDEAVVTVDENGQFTGSASVNWVGTLTHNECKFPVQIASGQVNYSGEISESDQMLMNQVYEPVAASDNWACSDMSGWSKGLATSDPIMISMPASGGVSTWPHVLNLEWAEPLYGSVIVFVIPVEDEAVSFIPGNQEARWDDFFSLFGALLALH